MHTKTHCEDDADPVVDRSVALPALLWAMALAVACAWSLVDSGADAGNVPLKAQAAPASQSRR